MNNRLGHVIRNKRKMLGLSQEKLGEMMNLSTGFIGQLERGETGLRFENLQKLFALLSISPNEVFDDVECSAEEKYRDMNIMFAQLPTDVQRYVYSIVQAAYQQWVLCKTDCANDSASFNA